MNGGFDGVASSIWLMVDGCKKTSCFRVLGAAIPGFMRNSIRGCDFVTASNLCCARKLLKLWRYELQRPLDFVVVSRDAVASFGEGIR